MKKSETELCEIYLDTPVKQLLENGFIDRTVLKACLAAKPPMLTAGDIVEHLRLRGNFNDVPGCRRPGRIPGVLADIAVNVVATTTPASSRPKQKKRNQALNVIEKVDFDFITPEQREEVVMFRKKFEHLPMFRILGYYLNNPKASRNDLIMAYSLGLTEMGVSNPGDSPRSLSEISNEVNLSRERVRQIAMSYVLPEKLSHPLLWRAYADHSAYYVDESDSKFIQTCTEEIPGLSFSAYAAILHRTTMLQNVEDKYLARRGWVKEISAWVKRLTKVAAMPRSIDSRISIQGLGQGGKLDTRIRLVVLNQIAPALGLVPSPPDGVILPKNTD